MSFGNRHTLVCCLVCLRKVAVKVGEVPNNGSSGLQSVCGRFLNFCCQYLKVDVSDFKRGGGGAENDDIDIGPIGVDHLYSFLFSGVDEDDKEQVFCPKCSEMISELLRRYEEWVNIKARLLFSIGKLEEVLVEGGSKKRKGRRNVVLFRNDLEKKCRSKANGINPVVQVKKVTTPPTLLSRQRQARALPRPRPLQIENEHKVHVEEPTWSHLESTSADPEWFPPSLSPEAEPPSTPFGKNRMEVDLDVKPELPVSAIPSSTTPAPVRRHRDQRKLKPIIFPFQHGMTPGISRSHKTRRNQTQVSSALIKKHQKPHPCSQCDSKFKAKNELIQHQAMQHENIQNFLECEVCHQTQKSLRMLHIHLRHKHENPDNILVYCPYCPESFSTEQLSLLHRRYMHSLHGRSPQLFCEMEGCSDKYFQVSDMNQHLTQVHLQHSERGKLFTCDQCGLAFLHPTRLRLHQFIHFKRDAQDFYRCPRYAECSVKFKYVRTVMNHFHQSHISFEEQIKIHICRLCKTNHYFFSKSDLEQHLKSHGQQVKCRFCGKVFQGHNHLTVHRFKEHPDLNVVKKWSSGIIKSTSMPETNDTAVIKDAAQDDQNYLARNCVHCSKRFSSYLAVARHRLLKHGKGTSGSKKVICEKCGKSVSYNGLSAHLLTHAPPTVECPFKCGQMFKHAVYVRRHVRRIHKQDELELVCESCGKKYPTNSLLNRHWKEAHGEKRYLCKVCGKRCGTITSFKEHVSHKHAVEPFTCRWCPMSVSGLNPSRDMLNHVKKFHTPEILSEYMAMKKSWRNDMELDNFLELIGGEEEDTKKDRSAMTAVPEKCPTSSAAGSGAQMIDFRCVVCGKKYLTRGLLNRHWKECHGEKRYRCKVCDKRCGTITSFKEHVRANHSEQQLRCQWCSTPIYGQNVDRDMLNHVRKNHTPEILNDYLATRKPWRFEMNVDNFLDLIGEDDGEIRDDVTIQGEVARNVEEMKSTETTPTSSTTTATAGEGNVDNVVASSNSSTWQNEFILP